MLGVCLLGLGLAAGLDRAGVLDPVEGRLYDLRLRAMPPGRGLENHVVAAVIDDQSIAALGRWPWPRGVYAMLLDALRAAPPRVAAFDLKFVTPTPDDALLAQTAAYYDHVCLAYDLRLEEPGAASGAHLPGAAAGGAAGMADVRITDVRGEVRAIPEASEAMLPAPELQGLEPGFANAPRDPDGVLRRLPLVLRWGGAVYPSLSLLTACRELGAPVSSVRVELGRAVEIVREGGVLRTVPVDAAGSYRVRFYPRGSGPARRYVYAQLLKSAREAAAGRPADIDPRTLEGRALIVGHAATGSVSNLDVGPTPLGPYEPLMDAHVDAVENICNGDFLRLPSRRARALLVGLPGLLCAAAAAGLPPVWGGVCALALGLGWAGLAFGLAAFGTWMLPVTAPVTAVLAVYLPATLYRLAVANRDRRQIKRLFGQYVSGPVLEEILRDPDSVRLGGEKRELTVLFSDIRGFTSFCEGRDPALVVSQLNEYLEAMTEAVLRNNGTLDKYIGDCVMAIFGAPSSAGCPDHAFQAVKAALAMREEVARLQEAWRAAGREPLDMGVGINTGAMVVGNMGSSRLWDYTVIGDEVNLGARLESLTRQYPGVNIIVAESTFRKVEGRVQARPLGRVKVKGKAEDVAVYAVTGLA